MNIAELKARIERKLVDDDVRDQNLILTCPQEGSSLRLLTELCQELQPHFIKRNLLPIIICQNDDETSYRDAMLIASAALILATETMADTDKQRAQLRSDFITKAAHRLSDIEIDGGKEAVTEWIRNAFPGVGKLLEKLQKAQKSDRN